MDSIRKLEPKVSILMPVYNAEKYISEAIDSILNQTFKDFEFIIINDGSSDRSEEIILSYNDARIIYNSHNQNRGYIPTLNEGIGLSKGIYIARMDNDDISMPFRIEKQVEFLNSHEEYGLIGTWAKIINRDEIMQPCSDDMDIRLQQLKMNQFVHTSVMIRKSILDKYNLRYDEKYYATEDYDLWVKMSNYCKVGNLNEFLLNYRIHDEQMSFIHKNKQIENSNQIKILQIENYLGISLSEEEKIDYLRFLNEATICENDILKEINLINKLKLKCYANYKKSKFYYYLNKQLKKDSQTKIRNYLFNYFIIKPNKYNWKLLYIFILYKLSPVYYLSPGEVINFTFKCLIFYRKV